MAHDSAKSLQIGVKKLQSKALRRNFTAGTRLLELLAQVGDTLNTDIELAVRSGMRSLLVLSSLAA